jgi:ribosomal protein S18 acetylase RimI-like enzyme
VPGAGDRRRLGLTTNSENTPAIGFYHAMRFEAFGTTDYVIDGVGYPNDVFCLNLRRRLV